MPEQTSQDAFFARVARAGAIRLSVRSIIIRDGHVLVQRPSDDPASCYGFIGGEIEFGDRLDDRLRTEIMEELGLDIDAMQYLFFVENFFEVPAGPIHGHEHYFEVQLPCDPCNALQSREPALIQVWLPITDLHTVDLRPIAVRDAILDGTFRAVRRLVAGSPLNPRET